MVSDYCDTESGAGGEVIKMDIFADTRGIEGNGGLYSLHSALITNDFWWCSWCSPALLAIVNTKTHTFSLSCHNPTQLNPKLGRPYFSKFDFEPILKKTLYTICISTSTRRFMHRTIIGFVQLQPNLIQNKNNLIQSNCRAGGRVGCQVSFYFVLNLVGVEQN